VAQVQSPLQLLDLDGTRNRAAAAQP
jgi:hypothetical protein